MRDPKIAIIIALLLTASMAGCIRDDGSNKDPTAEAGADLEAEVGEEVVFSGTGLDKDGSIVRFQWDFEGDGEWDWSGETGARIHVYDRPGAYQAVLQVEDDEGARARDTRWVNVTATVFVTVDWTEGSAFAVHVSAKLNVGNMEVDWSMEGDGPTPITRTFTHDAGIEKVNNTTYSVDPAVTLAEGQRHTVKVRLGDVVVSRRTVEVVESSNAKDAYDATYQHSLRDIRYYGPDNEDLWRNGTLQVESRIGWTKGEFNGTGLWYTFTNQTGVRTQQWVTLTEASAGMLLGADATETWWRYVGHGDVNQSSDAGFYVYAYVWDFEREMDNGSLVKDDWRRVGRYSGANDTNGSFVWNHTTLGNQVRQNGEGDLYEVLVVRSEKTFDGTNLGRAFYLHNLTMDYDASRLIFVNRTVLRESAQEVGYQPSGGNWSWSNSTWSGYLDAGGDLVFNPDSLEFDPELGARFVGPRPRVLAMGDTFTATNFYGVVLTYAVKRPDTGNLTTPSGTVPVSGVLAEAFHASAWGDVHHWFWVLEDGPLPGLVFEESISVERSVYGSGLYVWYRNIESADPLT